MHWQKTEKANKRGYKSYFSFYHTMFACYPFLPASTNCADT